VVAAERLTEKHLTQNQMFGGQVHSRSEPASEDPPRLHQFLHQRLWTTMDILGREPKDEARPWTNCRSWRRAACDYGSEGLAARPLSDSRRHACRVAYVIVGFGTVLANTLIGGNVCSRGSWVVSSPFWRPEQPSTYCL
jgi:hypothetical protein